MISDRLINSLATAIASKAKLPEFPPGVTVAEAYQWLPELTQQASGNVPIGIKAGITNPDLQQVFGLDEPLIGLLSRSSEIKGHAVLSYSPHRLIECEMAVTFSADGSPLAIGPAAEFIHLDFARPEDMTPGNVTLCNLGADQFICGEMVAWDTFDFERLTSIEIVAKRDGETLLTASPMDSLGGPKIAHDWCISKAKSLGFHLPEGGILLAGTNGSALPGEPGDYEIHYGSLGSIRFSISEA